MQIDFIGMTVAVLIPVGRSVGGWAVKALKDKKITKFEIKQLVETGIKAVVYGTLIYFGAQGFGFDIAPIAAASSAIILDMGLTALKENRNITKR